MIEINVPTGKYQSVRTDKTIPRFRAQAVSVSNAPTNTNHARPNSTNIGPSLKTSTPIAPNNDAHGPGFSGPMYLPLAIA